MKRVHLVLGVTGVVVFVLTGQVMKHHAPPFSTLEPGLHMTIVSRHIYLLGASLMNLMTGLYLHLAPGGWRRGLQLFGSVLLLLSPVLLTMAFFLEAPLGIAGRGWRSGGGLYALFAGTLLHVISQIKKTDGE